MPKGIKKIATTALTTADVAKLSSDQIGALTSTQVGALTTGQVGALTSDEVAAMTTGDVASITVAGIAALKEDVAAPIGTPSPLVAPPTFILLKNHGLHADGRTSEFFAAGTEFDAERDARTIARLAQAGASLVEK